MRTEADVRDVEVVINYRDGRVAKFRIIGLSIDELDRGVVTLSSVLADTFSRQVEAYFE